MKSKEPHWTSRVRIILADAHSTPKLDPAAITDVLGQKPDEFWHAGDSISGSKIVRKNNGWQMLSEEVNGDPGQQLACLLRILEPKWNDFRKLANTYGVQVVNSLWLYTSRPPSVSVDDHTIRLLGELNAEFILDINEQLTPEFEDGHCTYCGIRKPS